MNVIAQLEFEHPYYDAIVQHVASTPAEKKSSVMSYIYIYIYMLECLSE